MQGVLRVHRVYAPLHSQRDQPITDQMPLGRAALVLSWLALAGCGGDDDQGADRVEDLYKHRVAAALLNEVDATEPVIDEAARKLDVTCEPMRAPEYECTTDNTEPYVDLVCTVRADSDLTRVVDIDCPLPGKPPATPDSP